MWYWNGLNDFNIVNMKLLIQISNLGFLRLFPDAIASWKIYVGGTYQLQI